LKFLQTSNDFRQWKIKATITAITPTRKITPKILSTAIIGTEGIISAIKMIKTCFD
jgi:hypothetical protein